jgi:glycosyltransferase involved in cell wall biosynthesis
MMPVLRRKVLYVIDTLEVGGAERSTMEIACHLKEWQAFICYLYQGESLLANNDFQTLDAGQIIPFNLKGPYSFPDAIRKLSEVLDQVQPDLVVGTLLRSELVARFCCHRKRIPIIGTFVSDTYGKNALQQLQRNTRWKVQCFRWLNSYTARWCSGFLSNAEAIKVSNAKALKVPLQKIKVIARGRKMPEQSVRRKSMDAARPVFCNVGRLFKLKGQLEILKAFQLLLNDLPGARLRIAGEGPFRKELERFILDHSLSDNVELCGTVKDVNAYYGEGDIAVFASHYEGFSGAVLEAALAGIPIVVSDIPMNREVLPDNGAIFFPVMDVEALRRAMHQSVLNKEESELRVKNAFHFASHHFNISSIARLHEAYYGAIVAGLE